MIGLPSALVRYVAAKTGTKDAQVAAIFRVLLDTRLASYMEPCNLPRKAPPPDLYQLPHGFPAEIDQSFTLMAAEGNTSDV